MVLQVGEGGRQGYDEDSQKPEEEAGSPIWREHVCARFKTLVRKKDQEGSFIRASRSFAPFAKEACRVIKWGDPTYLAQKLHFLRKKP